MRFEGLRTRARIVVIAAASASAVGTLLAMCGRCWWVLELFTHFHCHYLAGLAVGTAFCVLTKRWWLVAIFGGFVVFNLALIVPLYLPADVPPAEGRPVRLMLVNVHVRNRDHERFLQLVRDESPDVIVVLEVSSAWQRSLERLAAAYPYRVSRPREDSFGIALVSRLPTEGADVRDIGPAEVPSVVTRIDCGENFMFDCSVENILTF